jgi:hypothetical protein
MLFWEDRWINGESVIDIAPCLYYLVPRRIRQQQSVCDGLQNRNWARSVSGGIPLQAIMDYLHVWNAVATVQLNDQPDRVIWRWTADGKYSAKSAYNMMHQGSTPCLATN